MSQGSINQNRADLTFEARNGLSLDALPSLS